jgi:hypothetical protein
LKELPNANGWRRKLRAPVKKVEPITPLMKYDPKHNTELKTLEFTLFFLGKGTIFIFRQFIGGH